MKTPKLTSTVILLLLSSAVASAQTATGGNVGREGAAVIAPGQTDCDTCDITNTTGNRLNSGSFNGSHGAFTAAAKGATANPTASEGVAE